MDADSDDGHPLEVGRECSFVSRGGWHQAQTEMVEAEQRPLRVETAQQHHASTVWINYPAKQIASCNNFVCSPPILNLRFERFTPFGLSTAMSKSQSIPNIDDLSLYDSEEEVPVDTPAHRKTKSRDANGAPAENTSGASKQRSESKYTAEEAREAALRKELESVRNINKVIEDVVSSLEKAKSNMDVRLSPSSPCLSTIGGVQPSQPYLPLQTPN